MKSWTCFALAAATIGASVTAGGPRSAAGQPTPEERAVAFLAREVPRWKTENKCYSCHNNGDAARALYAALRLGRAVPREALEDTTRWLSHPKEWDKPQAKGYESDERLQRIQFSAALVEAMDAGLVKDRTPLRQAAGLVAELQDRSGAWLVLPAETLGGPTTYGAALATSLARRTLRSADAERYRDAVARADGWIRKAAARSPLDAAALLMVMDDADAARRNELLTLIRKGQTKEGGWGPRVDSPPEAFDTAVVLLALARQSEAAETRQMVRRGRHWLVSVQNQDGSWPETTRPPGGESYAQRISTTAWATQALVLTGEKDRSGTRENSDFGILTNSATKRTAHFSATVKGSRTTFGRVSFWIGLKTSTSKGLPTLLPARSSSVDSTSR